MKKLLSIVAGLFMSMPVHAQTTVPTPTTFDFYIGGFLGDNHALAMKDGKLHYTHRATSSPDALKETIVVAMDEEKWTKLRTELDRIRIWKWKKTYANPGAHDGTQWRLNIAYADAKVQSSGSNSYPGAKGTASNEPTEDFRALLKVLSELTGQEIR